MATNCKLCVEKDRTLQAYQANVEALNEIIKALNKIIELNEKTIKEQRNLIVLLKK